MKNPKPRARCKVLRGPLSYPPNKVAKTGQVVSDIPQESLGWLVKQGYIEVLGEEPQEE